MINLNQYLLYAGTHPWEEEGWQMAFDIFGVQVSIACTPETQGVELMAWGLFMKPLKNVTPVVARRVLERLAFDMGCKDMGREDLAPTQQGGRDV